MKDKKFLLPVFFAVLVISFLFMVSAATGVSTNTTLNESNISGTHLVYATITECASDCYIGNVTFKWTWYNGTQVNLSTNNNDTVNDSTFSYSWDTTATPDGKNGTLNLTSYNYAGAVLNATNSTINIDLDNTPPLTSAVGYTNGTRKSATTQQLTLNISVSDATVGLLNSSNLFCFVDINGTNNSIPVLGGWCNSSLLNLTGLSDGNKTIKIWINDTLRNNRSNNTLSFQIDTTVPTATASCSPSTVQTEATFPCTCTTTDATSDINASASGGSSTSGSITSTSSTGTFTFTCSAQDNVNLTATGTATYSVVQTPGSGSSGGSTATPKSQTHSFSKITPGAASIAQYSDPNLGLKQIEIEVNNEAQSVKVTVTKYDGKPAAVSVAKTGKVYQYLQISVSNVADKISKAKITAKVEKSWATSNGVDKNNVVISKFDESSSKWNELSTSFASEDDKYYYYDAEVTSFSYFSISEKAIAGSDTSGGTGTGTDGTTGAVGEGKSLMWLWIVIGVIVLALIIWAVARKK